MSKRFFLTMFVVAFSFCLLVSSSHAISQISAKAKTSENNKGEDDESRLKRRVEVQVKNLAEQYELTEEQSANLLRAYMRIESVQSELRQQLNAIPKERQNALDTIVTPEQKKKFELMKNSRREQIQNNPSQIREQMEQNEQKLRKLQPVNENKSVEPQTKPVIQEDEK